MKKSRLARAIMPAVLMAALTATYARVAKAETTSGKEDSFRDQTNDRAANHNKRIHQEIKNGKLTELQAVGVHTESHQTPLVEREMASKNRGQISHRNQKAVH